MILKQNRIHSIHFSLAFEVNSLSLDEIRSVIGGKTMIGPQKEFQEVKNTYQAYDLPGKFDPFSLAEFNRLYSRMIYLEVQESGVFHSHNKGVFNGDTCIFMALPPSLCQNKWKPFWPGCAESVISSIRPFSLPSSITNSYLSIPLRTATGVLHDFGRLLCCLSEPRVSVFAVRKSNLWIP